MPLNVMSMIEMESISLTGMISSLHPSPSSWVPITSSFNHFSTTQSIYLLLYLHRFNPKVYLIFNPPLRITKRGNGKRGKQKVQEDPQKGRKQREKKNNTPSQIPRPSHPSAIFPFLLKIPPLPPPPSPPTNKSRLNNTKVRLGGKGM